MRVWELGKEALKEVEAGRIEGKLLHKIYWGSTYGLRLFSLYIVYTLVCG